MENALSKMAWEQLLQLRRENPDPQMQQMIAPYEHRAYAREDVAENPLMALAYPFMIPGYQALKMIRGGARTQPSLEQMKQGFLGVADGLRQAWR